MDLFACPLCDERFRLLKNVTLHLKIKHAGDCHKLKCKESYCMRMFNNIKSFTQHLQSHNNNRPSIGNLINIKVSGSAQIIDTINLEDNGISVDLHTLNIPYVNVQSTESQTHSLNVSNEVNILISYLHSITYLPIKTLRLITIAFKNFYNTNLIDKLMLNTQTSQENVLPFLNVMKNIFYSYY